ncbi:MAG TPA: hypothetical protein ENG62_01695, partial [Thermoplasmatales archaeon]|nr:hypothetical protein [Thermoplasmatales archaeon]
MKKTMALLVIILIPMVSTTTIGVDDSITIDPSEPNGENGWYISDVQVTFHAYDSPLDSSGLAYIHYRITKNGEESEWQHYEIEGFTTEYDFTVHLSDDGVYLVEFYAEDHAGNKGPIHSTPEIRIDKTPPMSTITVPKEGYIYLNGKES